jgi:transcriptional regulator with XRE-family HTH domain
MKLALLASPILFEAKKMRVQSRKSKMQAAFRRLDKSQADFADETNVDESTISRLKSGIRDPSLALMRKLAKQGIDVIDVFGIKSGDTDTGNKRAKSVQRSKANASKVSAAMQDASRKAQETERHNEPH